ncbi:metallophosphoesterase [Helicobacter valdiviensis]|uniref:Metallophosphoesterase n=1 Tax=Helicobacter valdiviensis TaxID=1458358 RepID=A0A2W6MSM5_9HELI|nr:metallophosphoesterase [Helicobacter valdiviensis]PZT47565.1 metallophosphoesterase [Helicobacter valdiviensis]
MPPKTIQENAIFIADSHHHSIYNNNLDKFFLYLATLSKRQIFLMGDIFDFLVGGVSNSFRENKTTLELLEKLSHIHEIYYFEGNHDFLLKNSSYFKNIQYFSYTSQPVIFSLNNQNIYLSHGDIAISYGYRFYTFFIRSRFVISFLNFFSCILYPKIISHLKKKNNGYNQKDFIFLAKKRIKHYLAKYQMPPRSIIVEGHYHHGKMENMDNILYLNLPPFTCKKNYFVVEFQNSCLSFIQKEFKSDKY